SGQVMTASELPSPTPPASHAEEPNILLSFLAPVISGGKESQVSRPDTAAAPSAPAVASPVASPPSNPFARKRPQGGAARAPIAPHLLRDALGGQPPAKVSRLGSA
ncbi:unnamed protein product, partial [Polarella glacialis]